MESTVEQRCEQSLVTDQEQVRKQDKVDEDIADERHYTAALAGTFGRNLSSVTREDVSGSRSPQCLQRVAGRVAVSRAGSLSSSLCLQPTGPAAVPSSVSSDFGTSRLLQRRGNCFLGPSAVSRRYNC